MKGSGTNIPTAYSMLASRSLSATIKTFSESLMLSAMVFPSRKKLRLRLLVYLFRLIKTLFRRGRNRNPPASMAQCKMLIGAM
jgi:hypothetical protein